MASLEMKHDALLERGLSMRAYQKGAQVPYQKIRLNRLDTWAQDALARALADDVKVPFVIDQRRAQTVSRIAVRTRRTQARMRREGTSLGLVIIDHLGLIEPEFAYRGNRVAEVTEMTKGLKTLAGTLGVPVLCLCQLNRRVEDRDDKRPYLSDLRESGSIEQDADQVILLHRPEYYLQKNEPPQASPEDKKAYEKRSNWETLLSRSKGKLEAHVAKNRHGAEAQVTLLCNLQFNWIGEKV